MDMIHRHATHIRTLKSHIHGHTQQQPYTKRDNEKRGTPEHKNTETEKAAGEGQHRNEKPETRTLDEPEQRTWTRNNAEQPPYHTHTHPDKQYTMQRDTHKTKQPHINTIP